MRHVLTHVGWPWQPTPVDYWQVQAERAGPVHVRPGGQLPTQTGDTPPHARSVELVLLVVVDVDVLVVGAAVADVVVLLLVVVLLDELVVVVIGAHAQGSANPAPVHSSPLGQLPRHTG
jgi:hypothetical protein